MNNFTLGYNNVCLIDPCFSINAAGLFSSITRVYWHCNHAINIILIGIVDIAIAVEVASLHITRYTSFEHIWMRDLLHWFWFSTPLFMVDQRNNDLELWLFPVSFNLPFSQSFAYPKCLWGFISCGLFALNRNRDRYSIWNIRMARWCLLWITFIMKNRILFYKRLFSRSSSFFGSADGIQSYLLELRK